MRITNLPNCHVNLLSLKRQDDFYMKQSKQETTRDSSVLRKTEHNFTSLNSEVIEHQLDLTCFEGKGSSVSVSPKS